MDYVSITEDKQAHLEGIRVRVIREDKLIKGISFVDSKGKLLTIKVGDNYSSALKVLIPAPPEQVERYFVTGKLLGIAEVNEQFDDEWSAKQRLREYDQKADGDSGLQVVARTVEAAPSEPKVLALTDEVPF